MVVYISTGLILFRDGVLLTWDHINLIIAGCEGEIPRSSIFEHLLSMKKSNKYI